MAAFRIGRNAKHNGPGPAGWVLAACLVALGLITPQVPAGDLKFQVSAVPILTCASSNATVGQIILTKLSGPSSIPAPEITLVFNYDVVAAPAASAGGFSTLVRRERVTLTMNRYGNYPNYGYLNLATGDSLTLSGTRLNLQGQSITQVFVEVGVSSNGPVQVVGPSPLPLARTGAFEIYPASLTFTAAPDGPMPGSQTLGVNAQGAWTAAASARWLTMSPRSGSGPRGLAVSVNPAGLALGTHRGSIVVSNGCATAAVTLNIVPPQPAIALSPGSLEFTASPGREPQPQNFEVRNSGTGALGWTASVSTQNGGDWLEVGPTAGVAYSRVTVRARAASLRPGMYHGRITVAALESADAVNSPQVLPVTLAVGIPVVARNGVVNAASFSREAVVAPGGIASLFGLNLAAGTTAAASVPLPTTLGGTQVLVNEVAVPLFFVSPLQINFQVPAEAAGTTALIAVVSGGVRGPTEMMKLAPESPGIFTAAPGGTGQGAVLNEDGLPNSAENPAAAGSVIQIFASGLGVTEPPRPTNQPGARDEPLSRLATHPAVLIGGVAAQVLFAGLAPGFVGLYQVNARVPAGTLPGRAVWLQIQMGGRVSNGVTFAGR